MPILKIARMGHPILLQRAAEVADVASVQDLIKDMVLTLTDAGGNPVLTPMGQEQVAGWEGCLSIPGLRGAVPRYTAVRFEALDMCGEPISGEARGMMARVLQHEVDHLDGILYPMRMQDFSQFGFDEEIGRYALNQI